MNDLKFSLLIMLLALTLSASSQDQQAVLVKGGSFVPLYGADSALVEVADFNMDVYPVTNAQFLDFVTQNPKWQKSKVVKLFADDNYLNTWAGDTNLGQLNAKSPVTNVSWFAAKAYCASKDKRLPTVDEWEYAAMADENKKDAREDSLYNQYILSWYETPRTFDNEIGKTFKNYWGVYDLHGLVWEWTMDFNSVLLAGESRGGRNLDGNLFCAAGAVGTTDLMNYAAFMRYAFRGSIKANYSVKNLGFRCVSDVK